jgi:hypothetical protein
MKVLRILSIILLTSFASYCPAGDFPAWMDEVEFKRSPSSETKDFQFNTPSGPIDPETGANSQLRGKSPGKIFKRPELPDFSKLREKAIKAETARKASDTLEFNNSINFARNNKEKLEKTRTDLLSLLKQVTDPIKKEKLTHEKKAIDNKLDAIGKLIDLVGSGQGSMAKSLSQLTDQEYRQALQLQKLIFGKPSETKDIVPPKPLFKTDNKPSIKNKSSSQNFYRPGRFESFYLEKRNKEKD